MIIKLNNYLRISKEQIDGMSHGPGDPNPKLNPNMSFINVIGYFKNSSSLTEHIAG